MSAQTAPCIPTELRPLGDFLAQIPSVLWVNGKLESDDEGAGWWWVKFQIDISHRCAWHVVQQFAHVANQLSIKKRLPIVFYPTSPPVYLNGGPKKHLCWVIETTNPPFDPAELIRQATPYFPEDITDPDQWLAVDAGGDSKDDPDP